MALKYFSACRATRARNCQRGGDGTERDEEKAWKIGAINKAVAKSFRRARPSCTPELSWIAFTVMRFYDAITRMLAVVLQVIFRWDTSVLSRRKSSLLGVFIYQEDRAFLYLVVSIKIEFGFQRYPIDWFYDFPTKEKCVFVVHSKYVTSMKTFRMKYTTEICFRDRLIEQNPRFYIG